MRIPVLLFLAACGSSATSPDATALAPDAALDLGGAFTANGLRAAAGSYEFLDLSTCCEASCAGNNPSSPYATFFVPPGPDETAANPHARADGKSDAFRLRADEAVVFVGTVPPPARYFGVTPYLDDRDDGSGGRRTVAASLSETLNNLVIKTDSDRVAIIATGDAGTDAKVRASLVASGFPAGAINTIVFDPAIAHFGSDASADTFGVLFRVALPDDASVLAAYIAAPGGSVWRITPDGAGAPSPLPSPTARAKDTTITETALSPSVDTLAAQIAAQYPDYTATELGVDDGVPDPAACIAGDKVCAFDNRDTTYPATSPSVLFLHDDDFYVVFGVDHQAAHTVTYANVAVYALQHLVGVASIAFAPGSATDAHLYAYKIARTCGSDPYCLEVPVGACPTGIANGALGSIAFRTYLEPSTATAPSPSVLVRDRVLRFRR